MEDEEETHSHASPESHSHSPPSSRITVTVASAAPSSTPPPPNPPPPPHHNPLTLALPIQQPPSRPPSSGAGGSGGGGREDCWSEGATAVLIEAWGERYMELSRGNLKQKHWKEVADIVSSRDGYTKPPKTDIQCKNRIDTVKKKYKTEKAKVLSGSGPSRWPFFDRLDRLIGPSASVAKVTISTAGNAQKAVPVGIPVGVRPISLPQFFPHHLQPPPHLQPQQIRPHNFPIIPRFNPNTTTTNLNNSGRQQQQQQVGRGPPPPPESESEAEEGWSADSADSLPPDRKRPKVEVISNSGGRTTKEKKGKREIREWGNSVRELTRAILKFGEAYEAAESAKLQQVMEMEKQRMKFAKELELQRIKFSMKTQLELSQLTTIADHNEDNNNHSDHSRGGGSSERREDGDVGGGVGEINNNNNHHHVNSDSSG